MEMLGLVTGRFQSNCNGQPKNEQLKQQLQNLKKKKKRKKKKEKKEKMTKKKEIWNEIIFM